jgi:hypothetical protein
VGIRRHHTTFVWKNLSQLRASIASRVTAHASLFERAEDVFARDPGLNASLSHPELLAELARETA